MYSVIDSLGIGNPIRQIKKFSDISKTYLCGMQSSIGLTLKIMFKDSANF